MTAATVSAGKRTEGADWLRGPGFDLLLLLFVLALALGLGGAAWRSPAAFVPILLFDVWALACPHVASTFTRIALDRESARRHWFLLSGLPLLVLAATAAVAALGGAGALFTVYYVGQTYHYTRQSYGIARAYRRRATGSDRAGGLLADAVIYAFPVWGLLHRASEGHRVFYESPLFLPHVPSLVASLAGALSALLFVAWAYRELGGLARGSRRFGHATLVLSHVLVTVVSYVLIDAITPGWLVVNIWHNAQYLLFVWGFNASQFRGGPDRQRPLLSRLSQPRNLWAYALFCLGAGTLLYAAIDQVGERIAPMAFPVLLVMHLTVNFHHYLVDGVIWKAKALRPAA